MVMFVLGLQGCGSPSDEAGMVAPPSLQVRPGPSASERGSQGQSPLIPPDLSLWAWDAGGFVPSHDWYGEPSWADVRMRLAGHLSTLGRDQARLRVWQGDLVGAAERYGTLAQQIEALGIVGVDSSAARTRDALLLGALRDEALCAALARGEAPDTRGAGLAALRARYHGLALDHAAGGPRAGRADGAMALQEALLPFLEPRADLNLDAFEDFASRHDLRVRLVEAYLDAQDPLGLDERWGPWTSDEIQRQALLLGVAAGHLGGEDWTPRLSGRLVGEQPQLEGAAAWSWPSMLAARLRSVDQSAGFSAGDLGRLPTGDSLLDVGGQPGPAAIGELERLGPDDPQHRVWLEEQVSQLDQALAAVPERVPALVVSMVGQLDAHGHGSRYYNIKQARNSAVRQLARAGEHLSAREVLLQAYPLHNQDWACPNRQGILSALEARLLAQAGETEQAQQVLAVGVDQTLAFTALVQRAERGEPDLGPLPPRLELPGGAEHED